MTPGFYVLPARRSSSYTVRIPRPSDMRRQSKENPSTLYAAIYPKADPEFFWQGEHYRERGALPAPAQDAFAKHFT